MLARAIGKGAGFQNVEQFAQHTAVFEAQCSAISPRNLHKTQAI